MHKKSQVQKIFWEFSQIFTAQHRNLFQDYNIPKSYLTQIRGFSWHNNEIKKISILFLTFFHTTRGMELPSGKVKYLYNLSS
jgi:hypothetical protein